MGKQLNLIGDIFNRLTVIELDLKNTKYKRWICKCSCGNIVSVHQGSLRSGNTTSCGCYGLEISSENGSKSKHREGKTKLYRIWSSMKTRCYNKKDKNYNRWGNRGITVCEEWLNDFLTFKTWALNNGYKENLTIDRRNNDGNYSPDNCRWTTKTVQVRNRNKQKNTSSKYIGVSFVSNRNKWRSYIKVLKQAKTMGCFDTEIEAAKARDQFIIDNNLTDFKLNNVL